MTKVRPGSSPPPYDWNGRITPPSTRANQPGLRVALDIGIPLLMAAAAVVLFEGGSIFPEQKVWLFAAAVAVLLVSIVVQIVRALRANRLIATTDSEIDDLRLAMKHRAGRRVARGDA